MPLKNEPVRWTSYPSEIDQSFFSGLVHSSTRKEPAKKAQAKGMRTLLTGFLHHLRASILH
ncbi:MAG: hypothetical protein CL917_05710 [Deltaproteobacteria bacterium]|nr:hypothetical protein [Deltaproteobacteria bacterium]